MNEKWLEVTLQLTGDAQLAANLAALEKNARMKILRPAMKKGAHIIAMEAKRRVPVRTGFLKKAIKPIAARFDASALVVMNRNVKNPNEMRHVKGGGYRPYKPAYIAKIVEFGAYDETRNRRVPRQPFLYPALEAKRQLALDYIAHDIRRRFGG